MQQIYADADARAGRYAEAARRMHSALPDRLRAQGSDAVLDQLYPAMGASGSRAAATAALRALVAQARPEEWVVKAFAMGWFARLGAVDDAFAIAEQLRAQFRAENPIGAWSWLWSPELAPFRRDARFQGFVTRLGMIDYWKMYGPPDSCEFSGDKLSCR